MSFANVTLAFSSFFLRYYFPGSAARAFGNARPACQGKLESHQPGLHVPEDHRHSRAEQRA